MSVIEEAKHYLNEPSGDIESDYCEGIDLIESLIKELEQYKAVVDAARYFANDGDGRADRMLRKALSKLKER